MARFAKYRADQVAVTVAGVLMSGFADADDAIMIENMSDQVDSVVGIDGEVAASVTNDRRVKLTLKLMQTSASNAILSSLLNDYINSPNGSTFAAQAEDTIGGSLAQGADCLVLGWPKSGFGRKAQERTWEILIATADRAEEGN